MRIIKYRNRIHNEIVELEVSDEVAKFLHADSRRQKRKLQEDYANIAFSLDDMPESENEESLTYHELVADKNVDLERDIENAEFSKIVWNVVDKLEEKQKSAIKLLFEYNYTQKAVANKLGMTASAFTQFRDTALKHLHILFSYDKDFALTEYYQAHYKQFADDVIAELENEMKTANKVNNFEINLNNVESLMKSVTQIDKISDKLGVEIPDETTKLFKYMTDTIQGFFKDLKKNGKYDNKNTNILNLIPQVIENEIDKQKNKEDKDK